MNLEPDKVYKVTKGNTDRSVLTGDVIFIDGKDGALVVPAAKDGTLDFIKQVADTIRQNQNKE